MKSEIIYKNSLANIDLAFLDLDPFSKREALNWLVNKASDSVSKKNLSIRHIASIWKWPKSKVARFIKVLEEKGLIETETETRKTSIILCNSRLPKNDKCNIETASETDIVAKADSNGLKIAERDRFGTESRHRRKKEKERKERKEPKERKGRKRKIYKNPSYGLEK